MKTTIIFLFTGMLFLLSACEEIGLLENANDVSYIYFSKDGTKDSTATSFKFFTTDTIELTLEMTIAGKWITEDVEFTLSCDAGRTSVPMDKILLAEKYRFKAGQEKDTISFRLINYPELQNRNDHVVLKVDANEQVEEGPYKNQRALISITDRVFRPDWWTVLDGGNLDNGNLYFNIAEDYYLGKYSEKKYLMFLEELDGIQFDGTDRVLLREYSLKLKYRVQAWNDANAPLVMMDEENNEPMTIPVVG